MKKPFVFISFLTFIILTLSVTQVIVSNSLSTAGVALAKLQKEINNYEKENSLFVERLLIATSLTTIASKTSELGFVESKSQIVLTAPLPIAVKQ